MNERDSSSNKFDAVKNDFRAAHDFHSAHGVERGASWRRGFGSAVAAEPRRGSTAHPRTPLVQPMNEPRHPLDDSGRVEARLDSAATVELEHRLQLASLRLASLRLASLRLVHARVLALLICALVLFLFFPHATASAASTSTGHITGKLLDGSRNNAPVANQKVTLQLAENNSARDFITISTDAQGNYTFSALQSDSTVQYAIYTLYQGAQYTTDLIDLSKNANQQVNLTVYDSTTTTENIAIVQATILLDKPNTQTGTLTVSEDFFFENLGKTTYVGQVEASHGKPNALSFSLPDGAKFLTLGTGFDGYTGTQVNTGFATNAAVLPGTSRFSFSFQVPYSGTSYHFTYKALYPTVALSLLTQTNFQTTPQGLNPKGPTNTQSGTYNTFEARTLSANASIQAQLDGLPTPAKATQQQPSSLNPNLLWLVALLIVLLALTGIGGYLYNTRRRKAVSTKRKQNAPVRKNTPTNAPARKKVGLPQTKEALLQELLELDKAYEAHKVKKAVYHEQRSRLKARLRELLGEQEETRTEAANKTARSSGKGEK